MIIEYEDKYAEDVKNLLLELQKYIASIDKAGYNIVTSNYKELYFIQTMETINKYKGKMYLYKEDDQILGLIAGVVNNDDIEELGFKAPMRGRIEELIVTQKTRSKGIGTKLLHAMEDYLHSLGCVDILIGVFGYNEKALKFYQQHGYGHRMYELSDELKQKTG